MADKRSALRRSRGREDDGWGRTLVQTAFLAIPVVLALLVTAALFNYVIMPTFVRHGLEVEVPDVTGRSVPEATVRLADYDLKVRETLERANPDVPEGTVFDVEPPPGSKIKPDRSVTLVVSRGERRKRIPPVKGQTLRFARLALNQDGYSLGDVVRVPSDGVPRNFVVASDPPPGEVPAGAGPVHLLVSDGPQAETWIMPDLTGREFRLTADKLRFAGFDVRLVESEGGVGFGPELVRATDPPPGAEISRGAVITLYSD